MTMIAMTKEERAVHELLVMSCRKGVSDKYREKIKALWEPHRVKYNERLSEYDRERTRAQILKQEAYKKAWRRANPEKVRAYSRVSYRRRADALLGERAAIEVLGMLAVEGAVGVKESSV